MAARRMQQSAKDGRATADARVAAMLARHGGALMRVARQWSLCHDDALDAFQRGLEIYVRRLASVDPATEVAWLKVVIRHEAMAIRRSRSESVPDREVDLDAVVPAPQRSVEDQVVSGERVSRSAEALRALKADEARALMLKAHGMSYEEIARHCGWTYTKVNRAITEGRRRFMEVYGALEAGAECERFAPILRALAGGTATSEQLVEIRPHLRRCPACRATVRDLHRAGLRRLPLFLPLPAIVAPLDWVRERLGGARGRDPEVALSWLHRTSDVPTPHALDPSQAPVEPHIPDTLDLSTVHLGPHGFALNPAHLPEPPAANLPDAAVVEERVSRLERFRHQAAEIVQRTNSSDLAAGVHALTAAGGGRIATVGTIVGLCLSGVGAGTVCLVTGVLHSPFGGGLGSERHPVVHRAPRVRHEAALPRHTARPLSTDMIVARVTPAPTATPPPRAPHRSRRTARPAAATPVPATVDPSQGTAPTSQEHAPISPAPAQPATDDFAAAPSSGTATQAPPAPAPATGGGEFAP